MRAKSNEQGVVVEHLLEMWHEPLLIYGIARESAADLIVDPAARHLHERRRRHVQRAPVAGAGPVAQQKVEQHRRWKLGRTTETAKARIVARCDRVKRLLQKYGVDAAGITVIYRRCLVYAPHRLGAGGHPVRVIPVRLGDSLQHPPER